MTGARKKVVTRRATQVAMVALVGIAVYAMLGSLPLPGVVAGWLGVPEDLPMRTIRHAPMVDLSESAYYATPMFVGLLVVFVVCLAVATAFGVRRRWGALPVWLTHVGVVVLAAGAGWYATHKREVLMPVYRGTPSAGGFMLDGEELAYQFRGAQGIAGIQTPTHYGESRVQYEMSPGAGLWVRVDGYEPLVLIERSAVEPSGSEPAYLIGASCEARVTDGEWFTLHAIRHAVDRVQLGPLDAVFVGEGLGPLYREAYELGEPRVGVFTAQGEYLFGMALGEAQNVELVGHLPMRLELVEVLEVTATAVVSLTRGIDKRSTMLVGEPTEIGFADPIGFHPSGALYPGPVLPLEFALAMPPEAGAGVVLLGDEGGVALGAPPWFETKDFRARSVLEQKAVRNPTPPESIDHPDTRLGRALGVTIIEGDYERTVWVPFSSLGDRVVVVPCESLGEVWGLSLVYRGRKDRLPDLPRLALDDFAVQTYPGGTIPRDFAVTLIGEPVGGDTVSRVVSLNRPARVGPWTLSLTAWDIEGVSETGEARFVVMLVGNRPGIIWVIVGGVMIASGFVVSSVVRVRGLMRTGGGA